MREILFRGKIKNGSQTGQYELDYVHGNLIKELETGRTFIADLGHFDKNTKLNEILIEVIPETVGQYTGLTDKKGKKIFEGDIVHYHDFALTFGFETTGKVVYTHDCQFEIEYDDEYIKNRKSTRPLVCSEHPIFTSQKIEVIGNIFDKECNDEI